jgi:hypothetical protein
VDGGRASSVSARLFAELPAGMPKRWARFLAALAVAPSLDRRDYEAVSGASTATAKRDLGELVAAGWVVRLGRGSATRYARRERGGSRP